MNSKKEKYFEIILKQVLSDKNYGWRDFDFQTGGHRWGKINSGIENVAKLYGIDSREMLNNLKIYLFLKYLIYPNQNKELD